jgi:5'-deoxynucleotidase YfbR-like HD superfamily hydrolase
MLSGRRLDLIEPSPLDIEIDDIALGLSRVARWNGQTKGDHAFSVAQHSVLVLELLIDREQRANDRLKLAALLHDSSEFVTADLITPFKAAIGDAYKSIEHAVQAAVNIRFGLPAQLPADWRVAIKRADRDAAFLEAIQLAGFEEAEARRVFAYRRPRPARRLRSMPPEEARHLFLEKFRFLTLRAGP